MIWKAFRVVLVSLGGLTSLLTTAWAAGALYFDLPIAWLRAPLASIYALAMLAALLFVKGRWRAMGLVAVGFVLVLIWCVTLSVTNVSVWQPYVAKKGGADVQGDEVALHNVRNCDYRTETDYTPHGETRTV